jgi:hypothetical protein
MCIREKRKEVGREGSKSAKEIGLKLGLYFNRIYRLFIQTFIFAIFRLLAFGDEDLSGVFTSTKTFYANVLAIFLKFSRE